MSVSLFVMPFILSQESNVGQIVSLVLVGVATFFFAVFVKKIIEYFKSFKRDSPMIVKGLKNGKKSLVVEQNPENKNNVIIY